MIKPEEKDNQLTSRLSVGQTRVEATAARILSLLHGAAVERTRDVVQLDWGGERGIVVIVTPEAIELRLPTVEWTMGAYGPASSSRLWKRVRSEDLSDERLRLLIDQARQARQAEYRQCRYCGEEVPPEHRINRDVCHLCASEHLGIVH